MRISDWSSDFCSSALVAKTIDRDPAATRQLAARARTHVRDARPRYKLEKEKGLAIADAFFAASRSGDMGALGALLAADVGLWADGGRKRPAAMEPVLGYDIVLQPPRGLAPILRKYGPTPCP